MKFPDPFRYSLPELACIYLGTFILSFLARIQWSHS